mmetsp:Transcript_38559/g.114536  ORF Transcript_38559/g.114536 Transcript_38559/m.114536 type:complete len:136 (-) Transcript_38559:2168-2575(-)
MFQKFKKDEVKGDQGDKDKYKKDDFFDMLSCDALERSERKPMSEQRRVDMETFGGLGPNYGQHGHGRGRGGGSGPGGGGHRGGSVQHGGGRGGGNRSDAGYQGGGRGNRNRDGGRGGGRGGRDGGRGNRDRATKA